MSPQEKKIPEERESNNNNSRPLRIAQLGTGFFATNCHSPVIRDHPKVFQCVAVWDIHEEHAQRLASTYPHAKAYYGQEGLDEILHGKLLNIQAVIMALPFDVQPKYVFTALSAGKHVLSEKVIETTAHKSSLLVDKYRQNFQNLQWSVAENYRYEPAILKAAAAVKHDIGRPFFVSLTAQTPYSPVLLNTSWRKKPSWEGGLFIDSFVHASAMLRTVVGEAKTVSAVTSSQASHIPDVDTMTAQVQWENGIDGSISASYASSKLKFELEVQGTEGTVLLARSITDRPGYTVSLLTTTNTGKKKKWSEEFHFGGIPAEFLAFEAACRGHALDRNSPEEATKDIAFVEACLESGRNAGFVVDVKTLF